MNTRFALWTIWSCFLVRALFYCAAIPIWEGYDEYSHFALVQYVATHNGQFPLGPIRPNSSRAVSESRKLTPGAWIIHDAGVLSYDDYFDLPLPEQLTRRAHLEKLPTQWSHEESPTEEPLYEAQQAPLYYWILAPFYMLMEGWSIPSIVWMLRSLTVLIASTIVPLAFLAGRVVFRNEAMALGAALVLTSFPQLLIDVARVSNEGLSVAIGSLFILLVLRMVEARSSVGAGVRLGIALGVALLTKAYFLALVPLAAVILCYAWYRNAALRSQATWQAVAAMGSSLAIAGWWYVRNIVVTKSLTGEFEDIQAMANSNISLLHAVGQIHWAKLFDLIVFSYIWLGDWSFLVLRSWMYRAVEFMILIAIIGVCIQTVRKCSGLPRPTELGLLILPCLTMIAGLCFHAIQSVRSQGAGETVGYYLYALVVPESILLVTGLARLIPVKMRLFAVPIIVFVLTGLEQFGAWFILFPYYGGLIRHNSVGGLPKAHIGRYLNGGSEILFDRLSRIGPTSSPSAVASLAVLYVLSTAVLLWLAYRITAPMKPALPTV